MKLPDFPARLDDHAEQIPLYEFFEKESDIQLAEILDTKEFLKDDETINRNAIEGFVASLPNKDIAEFLRGVTRDYKFGSLAYSLIYEAVYRLNSRKTHVPAEAKKRKLHRESLIPGIIKRDAKIAT